MLSKWYIGICICVVMFLGTFNTTTTKANQELIVHFSQTDITTTEAAEAIVQLQTALEDFGVVITHIDNQDNKHLKIQYYSAANVNEIEALLNVSHLKIDSKYPFKEQQEQRDSDGLSFDIHELKTHHNTNDNGLNGVSVSSYTSKSDRLFPVKFKTLTFSNTTQTLPHKVCREDVSFLYQQFTIRYIAYKIPEVRAGPSTLLS